MRFVTQISKSKNAWGRIASRSLIVSVFITRERYRERENGKKRGSMTFTFCSIVCRRKSAKCGNQNSCVLLCGSLFRDLYNVHTIANYFLSLLVNSKVLDTRAIINIRN